MSNITQVDRTRRQILCLLSSGQFYSGQEMGEQLGVSRAAISNHIRALQQLGLDIYSVKGKGYRLSRPLSLLDKDKILAQCSSELDVEVLHIIDSTNTYLKSKMAESSKGHVCVAEAQTAGRGRQGRQWHSPFGSSLYLSMLWTFAGGYQSVTGLSLAVGVAIGRTLEELGLVNTQLKWPNDIYLQGKKLGGVLIEIEGQPDAECHSIIGIGLNIEMPELVEEIDQPWTDLARSGLAVRDRNLICALLLNHLYSVLKEFEEQGMAPFIQEWMRRDVYAGQVIILNMGKHTLEGVARGINSHGALLVEVDGEVKSFYGGEISVRPHSTIVS